jgi:cation diffusion facilitator CzcD-associated flavoprotein CzcO
MLLSVRDVVYPRSIASLALVGAGQTGLHIAARFKQMGISTLVIEQNARIGDNWRKRYPTLSLHTPKQQHKCL